MAAAAAEAAVSAALDEDAEGDAIDEGKGSADESWGPSPGGLSRLEAAAELVMPLCAVFALLFGGDSRLGCWSNLLALVGGPSLSRCVDRGLAAVCPPLRIMAARPLV